MQLFLKNRAFGYPSTIDTNQDLAEVNNVNPTRDPKKNGSVILNLWKYCIASLLRCGLQVKLDQTSAYIARFLA